MGDCWGGCGGTSVVVLLSTAMLRGLNIVGAILSKAVNRFVDTEMICIDVDVCFVCDGIAGDRAVLTFKSLLAADKMEFKVLEQTRQDERYAKQN